jgi:hypothetical protein
MKRTTRHLAVLTALVVFGLAAFETSQVYAVDVDNTSATSACTPNCNNSATGWYAHTVTTTTPVTPPAPPAPPPPTITYKADTAKKTAFYNISGGNICEVDTETWYVTPWAEYSNGTFVKDQVASTALKNEEAYFKSSQKAVSGTWYDYPPSNSGGSVTTGQITYSQTEHTKQPPAGMQCP